jgi:predicted  nucleic acid-binding Zn-ribbon protein
MEQDRRKSNMSKRLTAKRDISMGSQHTESEEAEEAEAAEEVDSGYRVVRRKKQITIEPTPTTEETGTPRQENNPEHRRYYLKIRRSLRGRLLPGTSINTHMNSTSIFLQPLSLDEATATRKFCRPQNAAAASVMTRNQGIRSFYICDFSAIITDSMFIARAMSPPHKLLAVFEKSDPSDNQIAPLVASWIKQLIQKNERLQKAHVAKDEQIEELYTENGRQSEQISKLLAQRNDLSKKLAQIEPGNKTLRDEINTLKADINNLNLACTFDKDKVQRLNSQLASLYRKSAEDKRNYEAEIKRLNGIVLPSQRTTPSAQSIGSKEDDRKRKYDVLESAARDVMQSGGLGMASESLGELGRAMKRLKSCIE